MHLLYRLFSINSITVVNFEHLCSQARNKLNRIAALLWECIRVIQKEIKQSNGEAMKQTYVSDWLLTCPVVVKFAASIT